MRYLAIDYGAKRCGLAVCDPSETIVSPLEVIDTSKKFLKRILEIIEKEKIEALIVGLPLNMDGTEGQQVKTVKGFSEQLRKKGKIPIYFQDERLSSFVAEEKLSNLNMAEKKKKKRLDAIAAAHILETFLEQKKLKKING